MKNKKITRRSKEVTSVRFTLSQKAKIKTMAKALGLTRSGVIRYAVDEFMKHGPRQARTTE